MSYNNYDQYGGNPHGAAGNPYGAQPVQYSQGSYTQTGTTYGAATGAVGTTDTYSSAAQQEAGFSHGAAQPVNPNGAPVYAQGATPGVVVMQAPPRVMSNQEFLASVEAVRGEIRLLTNNIAEVGVTHQRVLSDPTGSHAQLDNLITNTQSLNTQIKDKIRRLEADALKTQRDEGKNTTKDSQIRTLKGHFKSQLEDYNREEATYRKRYQEQIAREYRIVNPNASDAEVQEAATADWGNEGVFQTALKTNRTAAANSVLGNVRARHNDIQRIEQNITVLAQLFNDLAAQVELQDESTKVIEQRADDTKENIGEGNKKLSVAIKHALNTRKMKWWCFGIAVLIIVVLALVLGLYFGLPNAGAHAANNNNP